MNQKRQPSYYAIIPSAVRYDNRLKFAERLLYGEITALLGKEGYCFASNNINIRIDRLFNYIINNKGKFPDDFESIEQYSEFYHVIERLEFNYTEELAKILSDENKEKLKIIIYTIKELFVRNKREVIGNCNRHVFLDIYDNCKYIEKIYKNTDKEINNFYDYYYASILKRYEAK